MKQHDRDSRELRELCAQRDAARATVRQQAERIAELEARVHTCGPTCSKAGCINRRVTAERDQLRAEVERLRAESVPIGAIRGIAVEAIRDVIGFPDLSNDGKHLSDVMDETARHATYAAIDLARTHKETP